MPKTNRPPLQAARTEATKQLIALHEDEHEQLIADWLADRGWTQKIETTQKWVNEAGKPAEGEK